MLPVAFCERMRSLLGDEEYDKFINSFGETTERYHALRINSVKASDDISDRLRNIGISISGDDNSGSNAAQIQVPWEKNGYYYEGDVAPGKSPYHEAGLYYIQEPSAMAPVHYLDPKPGEKILDLCAAPGGKSTQIAVRMGGSGILVTNEINRDRARILSLNIERLGITNALVLNETPENLANVFEGYFDKILVDAPCSGEGMFRKNENASSEWSPENVELCGIRQKEILDAASRMLLPGGRLVFSTCTFAPTENEESICRFLSGHPDYHVADIQMFDGMDHGRSEWISDKCIQACGLSQEQESSIRAEVNKSVRLWPHKLRGEGHFLCVLERDGELIDRTKDNYVPGGRNLAAKKEIQKLFWDFAGESLSFADEKEKVLTSGLRLDGTLFMFGEQLYICDSKMPGIHGLKCMRPGLHLGTIKKDRFEPSHALALAIKKEDAKNTISFAEDSNEIRQYLNGQTVKCSKDAPKGWTVVCVDDYSIGWAKQAGGVLKNHYPKGLRINY
ncbi:RNA methylase NOL1/NOP2/sun family [Butyrivibrio proteoclasticus B316]|uniref:RNA methylase NOL1/NOP2/sun family n=1 Tax=Butyrivibrio proteoclasticus (strain ATCC 51982 / DSM 14932 / B316) TaxID=515622 RepID=E0RWJ6_BUTPB|nr:RsmF rRNA methyltransferase first C-terminal domain-containing protein [Butyrivibrio proteoclasticus]ADL34370.1 RNA methylase NOL1/NOP2/sun family [Butyrivibrio proteoclasticus B316]